MCRDCRGFIGDFRGYTNNGESNGKETGRPIRAYFTIHSGLVW